MTEATGEGSLPGERVSLVVLVSVLFLGQITQGIYSGIGARPPEAFGVLTTLALVASLWAWFWSYSARHRITWVMDMAWFVAAAWPVLLPYYLIRTERWRGVGKIALFGGTCASAWLLGLATSIWCRVASGR